MAKSAFADPISVRGARLDVCHFNEWACIIRVLNGFKDISLINCIRRSIFVLFLNCNLHFGRGLEVRGNFDGPNTFLSLTMFAKLRAWNSVSSKNICNELKYSEI